MKWAGAESSVDALHFCRLCARSASSNIMAKYIACGPALMPRSTKREPRPGAASEATCLAILPIPSSTVPFRRRKSRCSTGSSTGTCSEWCGPARRTRRNSTSPHISRSMRRSRRSSAAHTTMLWRTSRQCRLRASSPSPKPPAAASTCWGRAIQASWASERRARAGP